MRRRWTVLTISMFVASLVAVGITEAQPRDASAKFRGDYGRPSSARSSAVRTVRSVPAPAATTTSEESYSLEPLPFGVGDTVKVVGQQVSMFRGQQVVGSVDAGSELRVLRIRGPWVGTTADVAGKSVGGWIWYTNVAALSKD